MGSSGKPRIRVGMLGAVMVLCLATRLGFLMLVRPWNPDVEAHAIMVGDATNYHRLAVTVLEHGRFAESAEGPPAAFRTPLYPVLMAGVYGLAGTRPWTALVAQALLEVGTVALLLIALSRLFPPPAAAIAAILYALDPFLALYTALPLTDVPFVFLLTAMLLLLSSDLRMPDRPGAALRIGLGGVCLGLATLVRPPSQFLPALIAPFLLWHYRAQPRRALALAIVFVVGFGAVLAPWIGRNVAVFGKPFLSASASYQLLVLNAGPLVAEQRRVPFGEAVSALLAEADQDIRASGRVPGSLSDIERAPFYRRVARRHLAGDPVGFARVYARGLLNGLFNVNTSGFGLVLGQPTTGIEMNTFANPWALLRAFFRQKEAFATRLAVILGPLLALGYLVTLVGVVARLRMSPQGPALLLLAIGGYFIAIGGAWSGVRYRLPAEPFLIGFTGLGIMLLADRFRGKRHAQV